MLGRAEWKAHEYCEDIEVCLKKTNIHSKVHVPKGTKKKLKNDAKLLINAENCDVGAMKT